MDHADADCGISSPKLQRLPQSPDAAVNPVIKEYSVWSREIPFRVDIAGIIEIMGTSLYSRMDTPIRELIQNAHDAVIRRRHCDLGFQGRIDIRQDAEQGILTISDDGIGLSPEEAERYLGTLGSGITGLLKGNAAADSESPLSGDSADLIGQFGIGLFSAFLLADFLRVESRREDAAEGVCWEAGPGTEICLSASDRETPGTTITLHLKPRFRVYSQSVDLLEQVIREYADFLTIPIYVNDAAARTNVINVAWFEATPDPEEIELALAGYFEESPLEVIPVRMETPLSIAGALYVSPERTPGFSEEATVAVTVRRMVISRRITDLLPAWGTFFRGVLELTDGTPTASREDLVRDERFEMLRQTLEEYLFRHLELLAEMQPSRLEAIVSWHRYHFAAAAQHEERLRYLLRRVYRFQTTQGPLLISEILERSEADPLVESDADFVVWYHADRRQERCLDELFAGIAIPCVHACRSFEEALLASMLADEDSDEIELRPATPSSPNFAASVLGMSTPENPGDEWNVFFRECNAQIQVAAIDSGLPVLAFLNDRYELFRTLDELRREGDIPAGFQRLIDSHFRSLPTGKNEVVLNSSHRVVQRALQQGPRSPLASVLRVLVMHALHAAGAARSQQASAVQAEDLDWIADALWGTSGPQVSEE